MILVGHGSYDGEAYKLNLPGPDIDGDEFAKLLTAVPARSQLVVNATSASGAVLETWAGRRPHADHGDAQRLRAQRDALRAALRGRRSPPARPTSTRTARSPRRRRSTTRSRSVADSFKKDGALATEHPQIAGGAAGALHGRAARRRAGPPSSPRPRIRAVAALVTERERARRGDRGACARAASRWPNDAYLAELQKLLRPARGRAGQDRRRAEAE